jgi:hypothetical protein
MSVTLTQYLIFTYVGATYFNKMTRYPGFSTDFYIGQMARKDWLKSGKVGAVGTTEALVGYHR